MRDAIVVGAGIVGSTIALALRAKGLNVKLIDDRRPLSGTYPSGGHLKPSWFSSVPKNEYVPAMDLLDSIWGLKTEQFRVKPSFLSTTVHRVDTDQVMKTPYTRATVTSIDLKQKDRYVVKYLKNGAEHTEFCRLLVIATGVWVKELIEGYPITWKRGVSFRVCAELTKPFIQPWAPFKQIVAHQQSEESVWVGDGTAILHKNWTESNVEVCKKRCTSVVPGRVTQVREGTRPYAKGNGIYLFEKLAPRCYLVTGAGKSGTIAAGLAARRILDEV